MRSVKPGLASRDNVPIRVVTNMDYPSLEYISGGAIQEKQKFERLVVPKGKLLEMFAVRSLIARSLRGITLFRAVQQIQETSHRVKDSRWYLHHCIPMWAHGRSLRGSSHSTYWQDQSVHGDQGNTRSFLYSAIWLRTLSELGILLPRRSQ